MGLFSLSFIFGGPSSHPVVNTSICSSSSTIMVYNADIQRGFSTGNDEEGRELHGFFSKGKIVCLFEQLSIYRYVLYNMRYDGISFLAVLSLRAAAALFSPPSRGGKGTCIRLHCGGQRFLRSFRGHSEGFGGAGRVGRVGSGGGGRLHLFLYHIAIHITISSNDTAAVYTKPSPLSERGREKGQG